MGLWVQIPFTKQEELPEPAPAPLSGTTLEGVHVLVADPARADRETAVRVFTAAGCTCAEAENGVEALSLIRTAASQGTPFTLCFLDRDLPETDAVALGRELRDKNEIGGTRLVMTTSLGRRGDAASAESTGFSGYLVKPMADEDWTNAALEVLRGGAGT